MSLIIYDQSRYWPNGIVPYEINETDFPDSSADRAEVQAAIDQWNDVTVMQLEERNGQPDYVVILPHVLLPLGGKVGSRMFAVQ